VRARTQTHKYIHTQLLSRAIDQIIMQLKQSNDNTISSK